MIKKLIITLMALCLLCCSAVALVSCGGGDDTENNSEKKEEKVEVKTEENKFGATISNTGGDFDVKIKDIADDGITITCKNQSATDEIMGSVKSIKLLGKSYDPALAEDGGALKMIDLSSNYTVATIDLSAGGTLEFKITCEDCKSAEDYKEMSIKYDEAIWDSTDSAPKTYRYYDLTIVVKKE